MSELKPCPFCGGEAEIATESDEGGDTFWVVECTFCGAEAGGTATKPEAVAAWNRRAAPENKGCADCSGIVYRQTSSGKIIPVDQRCGVKITPPCYQPDGDGCAYQIYGDNNDEPIDRCKACPLCYSDKARHTAPENKALTLKQLQALNADMENRPWVWIEILEPFSFELKTSAYYQVQSDYTRDRAFCCGYPGLGFHFEYADYGKTWLAYARKPEGARS